MSRSDSLAIVVDVGKSGVRLRVQPSTVTQSAPGAAPELAGRSGSGAHLAELIQAAWQNGIPPVGTVTRVTVGTTMLPPPEELAHTHTLLLELWPDAEIDILSDGVLAHAAALGGVGTVASIGTGTSVLGLDRGGQLHQIDAWGPDLGDRGSAAELGRSGLRLASATADGLANSTALLAAAMEWNAGALDLRAATALLAAPNRVERLASFAVQVCAVADSGDETAHRLVLAAAEQVADSCEVTARRIDDPTVVCIGGLTQAAAYRTALAATLRARGLHQQEPRTGLLDVPHEVLDRPHYRREPERPRPNFVRHPTSEKERPRV